MRGLSGKVAIVTGGAGGIGTGTVKRLVEEGVRVAIADVNEDAVHALSKELGSDTLPVVFDALDNDSVAAMVESTVAHFGRLDFLDNNHALINEKATPLDTNITDTHLWVWDDILAANARAFLVGARHAIPHMIKGGGGSIVNISSVAGLSEMQQGCQQWR